MSKDTDPLVSDMAHLVKAVEAIQGGNRTGIWIAAITAVSVGLTGLGIVLTQYQENQLFQEQAKANWQKSIILQIVTERSLMNPPVPSISGKLAALSFNELMTEYLTVAASVDDVKIEKGDLSRLELRSILFQLLESGVFIQVSPDVYALNIEEHEFFSTANELVRMQLLEYTLHQQIMWEVLRGNRQFAPGEIADFVTQENPGNLEEALRVVQILLGNDFLKVDQNGKLSLGEASAASLADATAKFQKSNQLSISKKD